MQRSGPDSEASQRDAIDSEAVAFLESLQSSAPMGAGFVDRSFRYVRVNDTLATLNGAPVQDHIGRSVAEVLPALWPEIEPYHHRVLDTGEAVLNVEITGRTAALPNVQYFAATFYPLRSGADIIGIGVLVNDITERKQAQRARDDLTRATVAALAATVETRDPYATVDHQRRVAELAAAVASELDLDEDTISGIRLAANIHDIGKLGVPAEILSRPGRLRPPEFELIQDHSRAGHEIMAGITFPWPVADMILQHHERLDGSGYPGGLKGEDISIGARIIAVTDTVEAVASHRPYRAARGIDVALSQIRDGRCTKFAPDVVDVTLDLFSSGRIELDLGQRP
jgi:putative nucleotidyltransferase with HDIG domain/PAS domain S-box-containing protein